MLSNTLQFLLADKAILYHSHGYLEGTLKSLTEDIYQIVSDTGEFKFKLADVTTCTITADTIAISLCV